jgi:DNA-binding transcriptional regulator YhcF (GntR family)
LKGEVRMNIDFDSKEPIYFQIIKYFKQQIVLGNLKSGDEIPSRRELATELKVNTNTVQRAYKEMEDMGMIETYRNFPSKIASNDKKITEFKSQLIEDAVQKFIKAMEDINVSKNEVKEILDKKWINN